MLKLFGLGMAVAVFLDALVIRTILLPAVLELVGRRTWSFPGWLDRRLPRLAIEPEPAPVGKHARTRAQGGRLMAASTPKTVGAGVSGEEGGWK